jgi:hypothetical protein
MTLRYFPFNSHSYSVSARPHPIFGLTSGRFQECLVHSLCLFRCPFPTDMSYDLCLLHFAIIKILWLDFMVEWLTLLLRIRGYWVQISARRRAITTDGFRGFPSPSKRIPGLYLEIRPLPLPSELISIHHSLIALSFRLYIILVTGEAP